MSGTDKPKTLQEIERAAIEASLKRNNWDKRATAKELGVSLKTIYNKLNSYKETAK